MIKSTDYKMGVLDALTVFKTRCNGKNLNISTAIEELLVEPKPKFVIGQLVKFNGNDIYRVAHVKDATGFIYRLRDINEPEHYVGFPNSWYSESMLSAVTEADIKPCSA